MPQLYIARIRVMQKKKGAIGKLHRTLCPCAQAQASAICSVVSQQAGLKTADFQKI
jgi:hypothetical protein